MVSRKALGVVTWAKLPPLVIFGAGGLARQLLEPVKQQAAAGRAVCFVSPDGPDELLGFPVQRPGDIPVGAECIVAIADPFVRRRIVEQRPDASWGSLHVESANVSPDARVGEGTILLANAIIEPTASIGRHFIANLGSYVPHQAVLGDFVTFAPNVACGGSVQIGDCVFVGMGACIRPGIRIGEAATIGMGSVVMRDVPAGATVFGNPARIVRPGA